ncbi:glycerol-3-phosphate dehydrogenase [NAD(P)+] [Clostridia bacterium]|nr:glycerol-3-phosphate dehydrogenase [NAD(P)+] [Clostridia bacterium]
MSKISILGSGTWGTALAILLSRKGHQVTLWSALPKELEQIKEKHKHPSLPEAVVSEEILLEPDLEKAVRDKEVLILAVPSIFVRETAKKLRPFLPESKILVNVAKGIEEKSLKTLSEVVQEELPSIDVAVLSGPSHAEEVSRFLPTTCVIGAKTKKTANFLQEIFMSEVFRVYTSPDILGIELGAALKNVIALAAGAADGLGFGDNSKAALITRGIAEITRLGLAMGGKAQTFAGLSGIGDLIVTCASVHSRNHKAGMLIGQGLSVQEAMEKVKMVVEGVYSAKAALELAKKYQVETPIIREVNAVLFSAKDPREAVLTLMTRDKITEHMDLDW